MPFDHNNSDQFISNRKSSKFIKLYSLFVKGYETTARMLIEKGANINAIDDDGNSCLLAACLTGGRTHRIKLT